MLCHGVLSTAKETTSLMAYGHFKEQATEPFQAPAGSAGEFRPPCNPAGDGIRPNGTFSLTLSFNFKAATICR